MRNIFTVNATQAVVSESHPEGIMTTVDGYPKNYDSRTYERTEANPNGNPDTALIVAQADYAAAVRDLTTANNPNRAGWAVTLERWDGVQLARKAYGSFPDMTPQPEPEPEPEEHGEQ